jgi:hypothetical protein
MASGAPSQSCGFIEVEWGFSASLLGSQVLRWLVPESVLGGIIVLCGYTWLLSHPTWGLMWTG